MAVCKDENKNGTWYADFRYKDWQGEWRRVKKRGFKTKREAQEYEANFKAQKHGNTDMMFVDFVEIYVEDMKNTLKASTMDNKLNIIQKHIVPYFQKRKLCEIAPPDVRQWQNEIRKKGFTQTYLKSINNQFSAIMNYACRFYRLPENPVRTAGTMGKAHTDEEMSIWTREQFETFLATVKDPSYHVLYNLLFQTGIRIGEAMALTPADLVERKSNGKTRRVVSITKTMYVKGRVTHYNSPKTLCSRREVTLPLSVWNELQGYIGRLYDIKSDERIFWFKKNAVNKHMERHIDACGLPRIRVHDLRHSHASMLIHMNKPILEISRRLGHKTVQTTLDTYAHLYPDKDISLADAIDEFMQEKKVEVAVKSVEDMSASELLAILQKKLSDG